jgi:hypothetical protein
MVMPGSQGDGTPNAAHGQAPEHPKKNVHGFQVEITSICVVHLCIERKGTGKSWCLHGAVTTTTVDRWQKSKRCRTDGCLHRAAEQQRCQDKKRIS